MLVTKPYERERALRYAQKWVFSQNPLFGNFRGIGGNCTNFVSQSIYAGACEMNETPTFGWYYKSLDDRSPSWTGVEFFYNFMINNMGVGPYGKESAADEMEVGDVIQLGREGEGFYHSLLVVGFDGEDILVATQTDDVFRRPLSTYTYDFARFIKILGVRLEVADTADCFESVYNGIAILPGAEPPEASGEI
ncbi:MAG: amidase domain-containing protein [Clostridia bacterium]|nr:amidase domain-containing protein [Clostridia bacterium]